MKDGIILLVEDNIDDVELLKRALRKNDIKNEIIVTRDGVHALDYLYGTGEFCNRDTRILPSLILLDINLPKLNGLEVLRHIRSDMRTKLLPVVVLTSSDEEDDLIASYNLGANSYIKKPLDFNEFSEAIRQVSSYWLFINKSAIPA